MPHCVTTRDLAPDERAVLLRSLRMTADSWAWVLLPMVAVGGMLFFLGKLASGLLGAQHLPLVLGGAGALAGVWPSVLIYRSFRRAQSLAWGDASLGRVEVVEVTDPVVVQQEEYNDEGPIYYLDIGGGKIMFVWGQWMFDPNVFPGNHWHAAADNDDEPLPFPSSHFRLHRAPTSGRVLRVENLGTRVQPTKTIPVKAVALSNLRECEIASGSLDDLPAVVARFATQDGR